VTEELAPSLTRYDAPGRPRAVILLLHGGKERSRAPVDGRSASWRRAAALQRSITGRALAEGVSTWLLRYARRGWNDLASPSPVPDARWALDQVRRYVGPVPVVLLGHSMGARTAMRVADDDLVSGVVGLAPWLPAGEPVEALRGRRLAVAHGHRDRITSYRASAAFVRRAADLAREVEFHDMGPVGHYMLRRADAWNDFAVGRSLAMLAPLLAR
jgi:predicted esterase